MSHVRCSARSSMHDSDRNSHAHGCARSTTDMEVTSWMLTNWQSTSDVSDYGNSDVPQCGGRWVTRPILGVHSRV